MSLESQRHLFDIPEGVTYLNCAYMSPQPVTVSVAGREAMDRKARPWEISPADFFDDSEELRGLFARLVNGDPEGVALVPSASYGLAVAAANLHVEPGQEILVLEEQFPSNVYPWRELAKRSGAELVTVPRPGDHDWTRAVLERLDERVSIVAVPNCHWTDGSLLDLVATGNEVRRAGAALVVDATQSLGALPFDLGEVRPDFLVCAGYKWLLGPYSLGYLYVNEKYREGTPIEHNWISRAESRDFAQLTSYRDEYAPGARRFDVGERSNFVLVPMALAALRQVLDWGVTEIVGTLSELTALIEEGAGELGLGAVPAERRAGHMLGLSLGVEVPPGLPEKLAASGVFVSVRGESIRVSPHLYNTREDVWRFFEVLSDTL
jgi:selenocysteine lyase/cysteine desulfurase